MTTIIEKKQSLHHLNSEMELDDDDYFCIPIEIVEVKE